MNQLLSIEESARVLGVSPWSVRSFIREGRLRPTRFCRRVLLAQSELEAFVANARGVSASPISRSTSTLPEEVSETAQHCLGPISRSEGNSPATHGTENGEAQ